MLAVQTPSTTPFVSPVDSFIAAAAETPAMQPIETALARLPMQKYKVRARQNLFHAGQPRHALYFIRSGCFRTSILSEGGHEKITGFRMRGDMLGLDALDTARHNCDCVALEDGEIWELTINQLQHHQDLLQTTLTALLAAEIRRDWGWMLVLGSMSAERRVVSFLLDLASRLQSGLEGTVELTLPMTRAELGNFLALQLETVTRALSHLQAQGFIAVDRRRVRLLDTAGLRAQLVTH